MPKTIFYARVSTRGQKADLQLDAARKLGVRVENIYIEKASGIRHDRPVLAKALDALEKGDTLACFKLDRIGRSLAHLSKLLEDLERRGIHFRTTDGDLNHKAPTGSCCACSRGRGSIRAGANRRARDGRPQGGQESGKAAGASSEVATGYGHQGAAADEQGWP